MLQRISQLKNKVSSYEDLAASYDDALTMIELADEEGDLDLLDECKEIVDSFITKLDAMTLSTLLTGEYDAKNAILTFHAGAGGTEAQDWNQMLVRMYEHWGDKHGFKVSMIDFLDGDEAGLKSAVLLIEGENAYGFLKSEMGVHRLVRVSPFDASGRRHTSFASVEVTPEEVASEQNAHVDIKVTIPSGIPVSLFPLRFFISSEENTLYPVAGKDISTEVRDGKYGFVKELSQEEYESAVKESDGRVSFVCNFLTNCSNNATMVYVDNDYFDRGIDQLKNRLMLSIATGHKVSVPYNTYQYRTWGGNTTVNVYPQKLHNNGTETVRVTLAGVYVGDISIDKTGVTAGIASELPQGCDENSIVRLEFTDKECTGVSGGFWGGVSYSWSTDNRTFSAECTLGELLSGNTIVFEED